MRLVRHRSSIFNSKQRGTHGKIAVMGLLERNTKSDRGSRVRVNVLKTTRRHELQGHIRQNVEKGATLHTDALESYTGLHGIDYAHLVIDHAEQYVNGNIHTNGLENFWALLKRGLAGTYVSVEPFHLFRYLDEQVFRFNHRKHMSDADRFSEVVRGIVGRRLTYQDLIGALSAGAAPA